ncbi:hypothetical protein B0J11DRAFT_392285, partial [Dendryphion nanum]
KDDVVALQNFCFISVETDGTSFEMHALVQLATRRWLTAHGRFEKWKQRYLTNFDTALPVGRHENWATCQMLFPHANAAEGHEPVDERSLQQWASILHKSAWYAQEMGRYGEAERMARKAVRARRKALGPKNDDTLSSIGMLALTYWSQGRWKEAEELEVQVMETRKRVLGDEHPDTLTSMANLASTYW